MPNAVIVDALRTPLGRRNGKLKDQHPVDLSARVLKAIVERNDLDPALVEDVIMGCVMRSASRASTSPATPRSRPASPNRPSAPPSTASAARRSRPRTSRRRA